MLGDGLGLALALVQSFGTVQGSYTYDDDGQRLTKNAIPSNPAASGGATDTYTYGLLNRLTSDTWRESGQATVATAYSYDAVGNRTSLTVNGGTPTTYSYDAADRLTSTTPSGGSAVSYGYDGNEAVAARGSDSFGWDALGRMTSATVNGTSSTMAYNGDGLRVSRTSGGTTTNFVWDTAGMVLTDGTSSQYVYGHGLVEHVTSGGTYYYLADGLGSTLALVDSSGTVQGSFSYDAYGNTTASGSVSTEYQFAGQQTDPTGLQYLRARYYDPNTGRFLSRDPAGAGNPYTYANGNPVSLSDPGGRCAQVGGDGTCIDGDGGGVPGNMSPVDPDGSIAASASVVQANQAPILELINNLGGYAGNGLSPDVPYNSA